MSPDVPVYLSQKSAAAYLGLHKNSIYGAFMRGALRPAAYVDECPVYLTGELDRYRAVTAKSNRHGGPVKREAAHA